MSDQIENEKSPEEAVALLFERLSFESADPQIQARIKELLLSAIDLHKHNDPEAARKAYIELDNLRFEEIQSIEMQDTQTMAEHRATILDARYYFYTGRIEDAREELRNVSNRAGKDSKGNENEFDPATKEFYNDIKELQRLIREHFAEE